VRTLAQSLIAGDALEFAKLVMTLAAECDAHSDEPLPEQAVLAGSQHIARVFA
jgi:hypothetical protein